jgi:perosamine synthetase
MKIDKYKLPYSKEDISFVQDHIKNILERGYLTDGGPYVSQFEERWAKYVGTKYSIAVNSCTTALEIILKCLDITSGSVIVPNYTFYASPLSILNSGASVIYGDIDPNTLSLSLDSIKKNIQADTKAVMIVHVGGVISDEIFEIKQWCKEQELYLIEDAACAHGAEINGIKAGALGDISAFSFHHSKVLTSGEGGIINTDDKQLAKKLQRMRSVGLDRTINNWEVFELGSNYKMSEITAVLAILHTMNADKILSERRRIAEYYDKNIQFGKTIIKMNFNCKSAYYKYTVFSEHKNHIKKVLATDGIELPPNVYDHLCSEQNITPETNTLNYNDNFPNCQYAMKNNMCLPMYNGLTDNELEYIVNKINDIIC